MPTPLAVLLVALAAQDPQPRDTLRLDELRGARAPAGDAVYASDAVRDLVARAAAVSGRLPPSLESYEATVETDLALVRAEPDGREQMLQLEQAASRFHWAEGRPPLQRVIGYRAQTLGLAPSTLSFFDVPWLVPHLYGDRIDLVRAGGAPRDAQGRIRRIRTVHPFASDREQVYRFSGGDTVDVIRLPDRTIPIARVRVEPRAAPERPALVFEGVIDVETNTHHIVRMSGRIFPLGLEATAGERLLGAAFTGVLFVEFENAEYDRAYWLPRTQRIEAQAVSQLGETRLAFRVMSRFARLLPNAETPPALLAIEPSEAPYGVLETAPAAVLSDYDEWRLEPGELSADASVHDFPYALPPALAESGPPRLTFGARHFSSLFRINAVEGVFTGVGLRLDLRSAAPGLSLRAHGGWAWAEGTARGGVEASLDRGGWDYRLRAERQLAHTNDFATAFDPEPGVSPIFAGDVFDYVDRRIASAVARQPRGPGWAWRLEAGRAADRPVERHVELDDDARPLRPAAEGAYWLARVTLERNAPVGGLSLQPGLRARAHYEAAAGELDWQRVEAGVGLRRTFGRVTLAGRLDGGIVVSEAPPPQALFELGTNTGLSGFDFKAFTGDRALLARALAMYTLPILGTPIELGPIFKLPAIAPSPSVEVQLGATSASDDAAPVLERFGWVTSDGPRAVLDLRLRFFGGGVSIGAARPLGEAGDWRFVWGLVADI